MGEWAFLEYLVGSEQRRHDQARGYSRRPGPRPREGTELVDPVLEPAHARLLRAVGAAEDAPVGLDAVANHPATAVLARRGETVDRALEAVERVGRAGHRDVEGLVVFVSAHFTPGHRGSFRRSIARIPRNPVPSQAPR